jgi:F-type H+-transporting ATPase subunit a
MSSGTPCMQSFVPNMVPMTGNCDPHFTWLKETPLVELIQQRVHTIKIDADNFEGPLIQFLNNWEPVAKDLGKFEVRLFTNADDAQTWLLSWLVCGLLLTGAMVARMALTRAQGAGGTLQFVPDGTLTLRNGFELLTGALFGLCEDLLGRANAKKFFWLSAGLFIYILSANLLGVVPGMLPPTGSMNHNVAMAFVVLILFNGAGIKAQGIGGYLKHMWGPVWWLGVLIFFIELLSFVVVRPFGLSLRLTGNMFGDHQVLSIMSGLVPVVYPVIFLGLGMFVSVIQAFVFTLLSTIYIALAVEHHDDH